MRGTGGSPQWRWAHIPQYDYGRANTRAADVGGLLLGWGRSWGLGVSLLTEGDDASQSSRFGWEGGLGTAWYSDSSESTIGILMTQVLGFPSRIDADFRAWLFRTAEE